MFPVNDPTLTKDDAAQAEQMAPWQETVISFKGAFFPQQEKQKRQWFGGGKLFLIAK